MHWRTGLRHQGDQSGDAKCGDNVAAGFFKDGLEYGYLAVERCSFVWHCRDKRADDTRVEYLRARHCASS